MPHNKYMPQYHCWSENDFQADRQVQRMSYPARRLYRALLQAAFTCRTRPDLPADDEELYLLAEADDLEYWILHKEPVLKMFTHFRDEDGEDLLKRERLTRDWQQMTETIAQKQKAGRARHGKSAYAERNSADIEQSSEDALKLKTETKIQTKIKIKQNSNIKNSVPFPERYTVSHSDETIRFQLSADDSTPNDLLATWTALSGKSGSAEDFKAILESYEVFVSQNVTSEQLACECKIVMNWAFNTSDYWPSKLNNSRSFKSAYDTILKQWSKYKSSVQASTETGDEKCDSDDAFEIEDRIV
jgi:hypothetical protein